MKVYIVTQEVEYEGSTIMKVFSLRYDACAFAKMWNDDPPWSDISYLITAHQVN